MNILNPQVEAYIEQLNRIAFIEDEEILKEMEDYAHKNDFPIIDRTVGRLIYLITKLKNPKLVVELGSGYGYSAYYFAKAMNGGKVVLTDYQERNLSMAKSYFERFGLLDKAEFRVGNAIEIAKEYKDIDILFLDLEKTKYLEAILTLKDNLKVGSLVIADNTLWYGKVAQDNPDEKTVKIKEFNEYMFKSKEFFSVLIPLRDGVLISNKIE
jgi:predicted O-methyltransferase YrrM